MKKPSFIESGYCRSRANCHVCQSTTSIGVKMRKQWAKNKQMPPTRKVKGVKVPVCPYGKKPDCPPPDGESIRKEYETRQQKHEYKQRKALPGAWERLRKGAVGLTKVALRIDRSSDALVEERKKICGQCPHLKNGWCALCGCMYDQKVRLASEACPDDPPRW